MNSLLPLLLCALGPGPFEWTIDFHFFDSEGETLSLIGWNENEIPHAHLISLSYEYRLLSYDTRVVMGNTCLFPITDTATYHQSYRITHPISTPYVESFQEILCENCTWDVCELPAVTNEFSILPDPPDRLFCVITVDPFWDELPIADSQTIWLSDDPSYPVHPSILNLVTLDVDWIDTSQPDSNPDVLFDTLEGQECMGGTILFPLQVWEASTTMWFDWRCTGDVDADGRVGLTDYLAVAASWGPVETQCTNCLIHEDIDQDGEVGTNDLMYVLSNWGSCP